MRQKKKGVFTSVYNQGKLKMTARDVMNIGRGENLMKYTFIPTEIKGELV